MASAKDLRPKKSLHVHTKMEGALGQWKRQQLIVHATLSLLQPSPHPPGKHRDGEP